MMKKASYYWGLLTMVLVAALSVALVSCGDDDDDEAEDKYFGINDKGGGDTPVMLFEEPFVSWGTYRTTAKSTIVGRGYEYWKDNTYNGYYFQYYKGKYKEDQSVYVYTSYKLTDVYFYFVASTVSLSTLKNYLTGTLGYTYLSTGNYDTGEQYWCYQMPSQKSNVYVTTGTFNDGTATVELYYFDPNADAREYTFDDEGVTRGSGRALAKPELYTGGF